jgi:glycolate oxidase FAD binding subunit
VLPSRLEKLCQPITAAGLGVIVYPGPGIVYAIDPRSDSSAAVRAIDEAVAATDADLVFEELPLSLRQTRDVFGEAAGTLAIARALKQRFDPAGILNPGRFQGRL